MIDADGFRANVGIILANTQGQVLWAKRIGHNAWQFPQGGIDRGETPMDAMYRELWEPNTQHIRFDEGKPEFDHWQWVSYWYPLGQVIHFKRGVYRRALQELVRELPLKQELIIPEQNNHLLVE